MSAAVASDANNATSNRIMPLEVIDPAVVATSVHGFGLET